MSKQTLTLKEVYHTKKGKLRARVNYAGRSFILRLETLKNGRIRASAISMPMELTSFGIQRITKMEDDKSIGLRLYYPDGAVVQSVKEGQSILI